MALFLKRLWEILSHCLMSLAYSAALKLIYALELYPITWKGSRSSISVRTLPNLPHNGHHYKRPHTFNELTPGQGEEETLL
jgi:hypothetical protein